MPDCQYGAAQPKENIEIDSGVGRWGSRGSTGFLGADYTSACLTRVATPRAAGFVKKSIYSGIRVLAAKRSLRKFGCPTESNSYLH